MILASLALVAAIVPALSKPHAQLLPPVYAAIHENEPEHTRVAIRLFWRISDLECKPGPYTLFLWWDAQWAVGDIGTFLAPNVSLNDLRLFPLAGALQDALGKLGKGPMPLMEERGGITLDLVAPEGGTLRDGYLDILGETTKDSPAEFMVPFCTY